MANNKIKTIEELKSELCNKVAEVNKMIAEDKSASAIDKAVDEAKTIVKDINKQLEKEEFARLRKTGNPMLEAIKSYDFSAQKLSKDTDKDTKQISYSIDTMRKQINLRALNDFVDGGIGRETGWTYRIYDFARIMAAKDAADLGLDWKKVAANFKLRKKTEKSDVKDPTSVKSKVELLQKIVDMMTFSPYVNEKGEADETKNAIKITSHDIAYITKATGGKSSKKVGENRQHVVKTAKGHDDSMIMLVHDVLDHHVNGTPYNIEYKTAE